MSIRRLARTARLGAVFGIVLMGAACTDIHAPLIGAELMWRHLGILQLERTGAPASSATWRTGAGSAPNWDNGSQDDGDVITPPVVIEVPSFARVGKSFQVTVYTIGPDGCWSPDGHEVRVSSGEVEISPYDRHSGAELCTRMLQYLPHRVTVTLNEPGAWSIRVRGRRASQDDVIRQTPVAAEVTITVVP